MNCKGLWGLIAGHNFEAVFDTEKEYLSGSEKVAVMQQDLYNTPTQTIARKWSGEINPATQPKRIKTTYCSHVCKRCGATKFIV